jgi:hypothetical protein
VHYDNGHIHGSGGRNTGVSVFGGPNPIPSGGNTDTGYASLGGFSADHSHSGSTDNGSSQTNWTPQYIDNIICAKN